MDTLNDVLQQLHTIFAFDIVDTDHVKQCLESYKSNSNHWQKYCKFEPCRYTRYLVDGSNSKFSVLLLCWSECSATSIHDHAGSQCFVKILQGSLVETVYEWPSALAPSYGSMIPRHQRTMQENAVSYMDDTIGLHRIENLSHSDVAVSLHVYIPPFDFCRIFDERTGQPRQCPMTFLNKQN